MVSKPTHDIETIVDHVYVSQIINTIKSDVTDCNTVIMISFYVR